MISLFDTKQEDETPKLRKVYLNRLHEIAYGQDVEPANSVASATEVPPVNEPQPQEAASTDVETDAEIDPVPESVETTPLPKVEPFSFQSEMKSAALREDTTVDSRKLAEEISPKFVEAFVSAFEEMGHHASGSSTAVSNLASEMDRITEHMQVLSGQLGAIRRIVDDLNSAQREFSTRLSNLEAGLREHEKIYLGLEAGMKQSEQSFKAQQDLLAEKLEGAAAPINERLDAQANAIRTLHEAVREREGHRDELRSALLKIQEIAGKLSPSEPLPDKL